MWRMILFVIGGAIIWPMSAIAQPKPSCTALDMPTGVVRCAMQHHGRVSAAQSAVEQRRYAIRKARQWPNPTLGAEMVPNPGSGYTGEFDVLQPIELGGKRRARILQARARHSQAQAQLHGTQAQVGIRTVLALYQIRQLRDELATVYETIATFRSVLKQYASMPQLAPEQSVAQSTFHLALEEHELLAAELTNQREQLESTLTVSLGFPLTLTAKHLPPFKQRWPTLTKRPLEGPALQNAQSTIALAEAAYAEAKGDSWPDLAIGPKYVRQTGAGTSNNVGAIVSLQIPLWSVNRGGRRSARQGVTTARSAHTATVTEAQEQYAYWHGVYQRAGRAIAHARDASLVHQRHEDLHQHLDRGVIAAPLVIELHRQVLAYQQRLHAHELDGVRAQWSIYTLEGRVDQEVIR